MAGDAVSRSQATHYQALLDERIEFQRCSQCGYMRWPPAVVCPECLSDMAEWEVVSGYGQIWSFAVGVGRSSGDRGIVAEYVLGAVVLDEGPFVFGRIVEPTAGLAIGDRVRAEAAGSVPEMCVLRFRVVDLQEGSAP
jgi:uncharacterized protein